MSSESQKERRKGVTKNLKKIITEHFANFAKAIHQWIPKARQTPHRINIREFASNHMLMKLLKTKDKGKNLKVSREK